MYMSIIKMDSGSFLLAIARYYMYIDDANDNVPLIDTLYRPVGVAFSASMAHRSI